jgi:hypothetical protein
MKGERELFAGLVIFFLLAGCFLSLAGIKAVESAMANRHEIDLIQAQRAEPETSQDRDVQALKEVALGGFAANVAIAASADRAQASMLWAMAIPIVAVCVTVIILRAAGRKGDRVTVKDFENEREKL